MARVFLSYDREDLGKARPIAATLEKAGHSVWWDRHIKGGAQYSKEIDRALKSADAVVVLWSEHAVESAWVRDEAAAGRDSGRLVPATLDATEPPLGFRQYQTIDLSRSRGGKTPQLNALLDAVESLAGASQEVGPSTASTAVAPPRTWPRRPLLSAVIAAVAIVTAGLLLWRPWDQGSAVPVVAVAPADRSESSQALAGDLLTQLGSLQAANADALELMEQGTGSNADLTFKIGGSVGTREPAANLALVDGDDGALLWSREFRPPSAKAADLRQQVAYTAARVLQCAAEGLSSRLKQQTLKLYLTGCAELHSLWEADPRNLLDVFARVTQQAPGFAGGWEKLLLAQLEAFQNPDIQVPNARQSLRRSMAAAREINPDMAEAYLAEAWLSPPRPIIVWMRLAEKAVERNPNHAIALVERARGYEHVGRMRDAIADTRRAVQIDPLSPGARDALASAFAYSGQLEAAFRVLEEAERLWPGASNLLAARYRLLLRYGDPKQALAILRSGAMTAPANPMQQSFLEARIDRSPATTERAINHAQSLYRRYPEALSDYSQALAEFGRDEELIEALLESDPEVAPGIIEILFRPAFRDLHRDPSFMTIALRYGLVDYWLESGSWPDLCFEPDLPYDCKAEAAKLRRAR